MQLKRYVLISLILFIGCTPDKIQKLEITRIGDVHLRSVTSKTLSLDVEIFLRNPYFRTARVKRLAFDIAMTSGFFGKGYVHDPFEMESGSTRSLTVPVVVDCEKVAEKDYFSFFSDNVPYHFKGTLDLEKPVQAEKVELDATGTVKSADTFHVILEHKTVLNMVSLENSNVRELLNLIRKGKIRLEVRNPFLFPIQADKINYEISLGRATIATGRASDPVILQPGLNHVSVSAALRPFGAAEGMLQGMLDQQVPALSLTARFNLKHQDRNLDIHLKYPPN